MGLLREENGSNEEMDTGVKFVGTTVNQRLMMAIEEKDAGAIEFCLRNGADPNTQFGTNKVTALHLATTIDAPETVQTLIKNGADVKVADSRGITPLHLAAGLGFSDIVLCLISAGADINAQDLIKEDGGGQETSLHRAAIGGHLDALRKLLLAGAKVKFDPTWKIKMLIFEIFHFRWISSNIEGEHLCSTPLNEEQLDAFKLYWILKLILTIWTNKELLLFFY